MDTLKRTSDNTQFLTNRNHLIDEIERMNHLLESKRLEVQDELDLFRKVPVHRRVVHSPPNRYRNHESYYKNHPDNVSVLPP